MEIFLIILIFVLNILCFVFNEVGVYRRGGDVYNYTIKLDKLLRKIGL